MKPILLLLVSAIAINTNAQQKIFAVSGNAPGSTNWNWLIFQTDGSSANNMLLDGSQPAKFVNAQSKKAATPQLNSGSADVIPGMEGIAALAYDKAHNRLYFSPMFRTGGIRYIELNKATNPVNIYDMSYNQLDRITDGEGGNFTRMVIDQKGNGYAISNDGYSMLRFGTGNKVFVERMDGLVDAPANGTVSVHDQCSSWGGDIIACDNDKLYLFTYNKYVYEIEPTNREAKLLGQLKGIDDNFTINGAAVNDKNEILLGSSIIPGTKYILKDLQSLQTEKLVDPTWMNASDLASAYVYKTKKDKKLSEEKVDVVSVRTYPNPVTKGVVTVNFEKIKAGDYTIHISDNNGRVVQVQQVKVQSQGQSRQINLSGTTSGNYTLVVKDKKGKQVAAQKLILQ